jgi:hypothetical protein
LPQDYKETSSDANANANAADGGDAIPSLEWATTPTSHTDVEGNVRCRVTTARRRRPLSALPVRLERQVEIEPVNQRASSIEPEKKRRTADVIEVSQKELERYGSNLPELRKLTKKRPSSAHRAAAAVKTKAMPQQEQVDPQTMTAETKEAKPAKELSFKEAFLQRCIAPAEIRDPWQNCPNPEKLRVASDMDLIFNQFLPPSPAYAGSPVFVSGDADRRKSSTLLQHLHNHTEKMVPEVMHVVTPDIHQRFAGRYNLVPHRLANGRPIWKQVGCGAERWLYTGRSGRWYIGGRKEENANFQCSSGVIRSKSVYQDSPSALRNGWQSFSYGQWTADPAIKVWTMPAPAMSSATTFMITGVPEDYAGKYDSSGDWANGFPVWKQRVGECWLFGGTDGRWYIGGFQKKLGFFQAPKEGTDGLTFLRSGTVHNGTPPEHCFAAWEIADNENVGSWVADRAIAVKVPEWDQRCSEADERPYYDIPIGVY